MIFVPFLIVDSQMKLGSAIQRSYEVVATNFWRFAGLWLIGNLFSYFGIVIVFVGVILTLPLGACIAAAAYRDIFGEQGMNRPGLS